MEARKMVGVTPRIILALVLTIDPGDDFLLNP
jgi:hypothetical protein